MGRIVILGSASAVPVEGYENTHLLVEVGEQHILVDCPGNPVNRLSQVGVKIIQITDIILTHFHPDHVSGFASLLMSMWLVGRKRPINVYGLEDTLWRAEKMLELYDWQKWPGFFTVNFATIQAQEKEKFIERSDLVVYASPVEHLIPTVGLRFEFIHEAKSATYSCDTQPSQIVCRLAQHSDILIHESTGPTMGHTPPEKAGEIAAQAEVGSLYLIHYPPKLVDLQSLLEKARSTYSGPVYVAKDLQVIPVD